MSLILKDVCFSYQRGAARVLNNLSMIADVGELLALTGPSGSGKTTLLQIIGGLLDPDSGTVTGRPPVERIRWVFQIPTALGRRSVIDNVRLGATTSGLQRREVESRAREMLERVGLSQHAHRRTGTLSGGELQRVQIARALLGSPPLVIADEPSAQLDRRNAETVFAALQHARGPESTVILATHDSHLAEACDKVFVIRDGHAIESE